jgi:arylsulfate sulfotransferase
MNKNIIIKLSLFLILIFSICSCKRENDILNVTIGNYHGNELIIKIDVTTNTDSDVVVAYWTNKDGVKLKVNYTPVSKDETSHSIIINNVSAETVYNFQVISTLDKQNKKSKIYTFKTPILPEWLQNQFKVTCASPELLSQEFKKGFMLFSKKETPGVAYIVDYNGNLRWYHSVPSTGFKMVRFTNEQTIISILGKQNEPTIYGSQILEVNLKGDTLTHLKIGDGDFKFQIHHEILKKSPNEIATIFLDKKVMDLSSVGGKVKDTVCADGIIIIDRNGKQLWKWSVFDVLDPLKEKDILKKKKDWVHANSLNYDKDGNFIISFYNTGQIWKVDAQSGKVIWKLGNGGTLKMPVGSDFSNSHAVHYNKEGDLMFFDNGVIKQQSSIISYIINDNTKEVKSKLHIILPQDIFSDRMGSAYSIDGKTFLVCSSKSRTSVLVNLKGEVLWSLESTMLYRVQFVPEEDMKPFLFN